ncbi:hypothetical protein MTAT_27550 [Moorella thermoacetica]|uniref:Uncharacterized protein n=1 Tax=Neomoorella thermoacetica TaxID=1525 RepID=A0AAC9HFI2_NEOTH|nr:hypothetical protein Maut_00301 [Moorella thermoacetica]TYL08323.1 hypothetical protein MTAT_27550 [Moorella thermoacetica]
MDIILSNFRWIYGVRRSIINRVVTLEFSYKGALSMGPNFAVGWL